MGFRKQPTVNYKAIIEATRRAQAAGYAKYARNVRPPYVTAARTAAASSTSAFLPYMAAAGYGIARGVNRGKAIVNYIKGNKTNQTKVSTPVQKKKVYTSGNYKGRVTSKKINNPDKKYNLNGIHTTIENGGSLTATSTGAVYPVHGIATNQVLRSAFCAIVKEIARQRKTDIQNWTDLVTYNDGQFDVNTVFTYINNPGEVPRPAPVTLQYSLPHGVNNITWRQYAVNLLAYWQDNSGAGSVPKEIIKIEVYNLDTTSTRLLPLATLFPSQIKFDIQVKSELMIQNRTLAEGGTEGNADDTDDIESMPLTGRLYTGTQSWTNAMELKNQGTASGNQGTKSTVCNKTTGLSLLQVGTEYADSLKIPPAPWVLGFKKYQKVVINPGEMRKTSFTFNTIVSFNKLFQIFAVELGHASTVTQSAKVPFGFIQAFGLEKSLDSLRNAGTNITVAYQIKQDYSCAIIYKKKVASSPHVEVSSTAISYTTDKPT